MATLNRLIARIDGKQFPAAGGGQTTVLKDLELDVEAGEFVAVIGPSGCGKSTFLNILAGLDADYDGSVSLPRQHNGAGPAVGYVFQNPRLLPWRTVLDNVRLVLSGEPESESRALDLIRQVGMAEQTEAFPTALSVGMSRRVALARAFAIDPDVLLMDEPFVSLDPPSAKTLRLLLLDVWAARPTTVVFVTHDLREAIMLADRIMVLPRRPGPAVAMISVPIPRSRRADEDAVEEFRLRLLADHRGSLREVA